MSSCTPPATDDELVALVVLNVPQVRSVSVLERILLIV